MNQLRELTLVHSRIGSIDTENTPIVMPGMFTTNTESPATLRLSAVVISWTNYKYYTHTTTLILSHFGEATAPTVDNLHTILDNLKNLQHLAIQFVQCKPGNIHKPTTLHMAKLKSLSLTMASSTHIAKLLSYISAPNLSDFDIVIASNYDIQGLIHCTQLLHNVSTLTIDATYNINDIRLLYKLMPAILHIDLTLANNRSLTTTIDKNDSQDNLLPHLQTAKVALWSIQLQDIKRFIQKRVLLPPLQQLTIHTLHAYDYAVTERDRSWLQERVEKLVIKSGLSQKAILAYKGLRNLIAT
ncbi:hypothetical protein DFH06DRAFT_1152844 [Mycena polygramma]|nr:hypothetical protein DFH06DRAFT_1152844 [Mycena polygramma]